MQYQGETFSILEIILSPQSRGIRVAILVPKEVGRKRSSLCIEENFSKLLVEWLAAHFLVPQ